MRTLIVYYSKYGFTKECAENLRNNIKGEVKLVHINEDYKYDLSYYDNIVIGSAVYMGMINGRIKDFCVKNKDVLKDKKTYLFLCSGVRSNFELYLEQNLEKEFVDMLEYKDHFGGELRMDKLSFMDKMIAKMASRAHKDSEKPTLMIENINKFILEINK